VIACLLWMVISALRQPRESEDQPCRSEFWSCCSERCSWA
jgi:hypothetical protein